jgi:hypothetical protein
MRANQAMPDVNFVNLEQSRGHARRAPLCYSRQTPEDGVDQTRIDPESALIAVYSVATCAAAAFLVVYGGWGL